MYLDDSTTADEWLFGSTVAWTEDADLNTGDGGRVFVWKVKLESADHNPDPTQIFCMKLWKDNGKQYAILGLKQTLVNGNIHGLAYKNDGRTLYFVIDWIEDDKFKSETILEKVELPCYYAVFYGTNKWTTKEGHNVYQAYLSTNH